MILWIEVIRTQALATPSLAKFAIGMALVVGMPALARLVRLPAVVLLLLSGVVIGPHGLDILGQNRPVADFFAELGKLLLMFFAGLEIDLQRFREARRKTAVFGVLTTFFPLLLGTGVGFLFGYGAIQSVVLGSLLASHTLLANPIVKAVGASRLEPVTVTYGATVLSDTISLVIFAVCVSIFQGGLSVAALAIQIGEIAVFVLFVLLGLSRIGEFLLARVRHDQSATLVLLLLMVAIAGLLAQLINLPGIVGAFLVGLAVNRAAQGVPAKEKLEFLGNSFFVPIFFVVTGCIIDPVAFVHSVMDNFPLAASVIGALLLGKCAAAAIAGRAFGYTFAERATMWSLTLPQVAATLAAALVAYETFNPAGQRLVDDHLINVVLVLMLTTAILGPLLTGIFAPRMMAGQPGGPAHSDLPPADSRRA